MELVKFNTAYDLPSKKDYQFEIPDDYAMGYASKRPTNKITVQNQKETSWCTMFALNHIINGYNLLEDEKYDVHRNQIDSYPKRKEYCKKRWYDGWDNLQNQCNIAIAEWLISGYSTISNEIQLELQIKKMKQALDLGCFMYTGSGNWDRWAITKTGIYTLRTDDKFVWHAFDIIDYVTGYFVAINARGPDWNTNWYFLIPEALVGKLYNKLVIVDTDDSQWFAEIKEKSIAMEAVRQYKKQYHLTLVNDKFRQSIHDMANFLREKYKFTDNDL